MATKLKNMRIRKVDFVDEGANPDAHVPLFKSKEGQSEEGSNQGFLRKMLSFIGKAAGMEQKEIDNAVDEIAKGDSKDFNEVYSEAKNMKIADEIWDICYALYSSLYSILNDEDLDDSSSESSMKESLSDFNETMSGLIGSWSRGSVANISKSEVTTDDVEMMKSIVERLNKSMTEVSQAVEETAQINNDETKGVSEDMKFDKSKLSPAESAFLDEIIKKAGVEDEPSEGNAQPEGDSVAKGLDPQAVTTLAPAPVQNPAQVQPENTPADGEGIYKGLHPEVARELEELKKFREATETRELEAVASKYEIIGKKKEELVPLFKSLKAHGGTAYADMIAILDQSVATVQQSGVFSEIGKSTHGYSASKAETKVDEIAKSMMETDPSLSFTMAKAKAWEEHPELVEQYEEQQGM